MTENDFLEVIDLQMDMANIHRDIFMECIDDDDLSPENSLAVIMASQFLWLYYKFKALWHKSIALEDLLTKKEPSMVCFLQQILKCLCNR
ncbi:hypothetical protein [Candidatus Symbiobacter mobilis]|uniref:Uncharacterized protein n=1 Tax=Candidatus Symbiobacter mobilis CR TaxID=946483 RepID=U5N7V9_9BURK|nr:hypothetical protein [Candidatus Symbiobacter mobilis]AGX87646.1 hypothetical protein Cenrod_1561 [Candidatus Symbiobacter mobilis CR]